MEFAMGDQHEERSEGLIGRDEKLQKRKISGKIKTSMKKLKGEMRVIGEQQKQIRAGQKEIRDKFGELESECEQLKKETILISEQAERNQHRLDLMFQILKAREQNNLHEAAKLTESLRECMMKQTKKSKH